MTRGVLLAIVVVLAMTAAVLTVRAQRGNAVRVAQDDIRVVPNRGPVRVEHQLVRIPATAAVPSVPRPGVTRMTRRATRDAGVLAKARRFLVGTGRHVPRPFPTVEERSH